MSKMDYKEKRVINHKMECFSLLLNVVNVVVVVNNYQ